MRTFLMAMILFGFVSCSFFESKDEKTQELVNQEIQQIDWNNVDNYPLFSDCDETQSKVVQKNCFEEKLLAHVAADLKALQWTSESEINAVIYLDFMIENTGEVSIVNIKNKEILGKQMQQFDAKIKESLKSLPQIEPALKRGIPVRAKFRIPIFLNSK